MGKRKGKGGKRCHDWREIGNGVAGAWRWTKHGINIRFDQPVALDHQHGVFAFAPVPTGHFIDNPPSKWGKSV